MTKVVFDPNLTSYRGIGLMCGTSQDALDIALIKFIRTQSGWKFEILKSEMIDIPYDISTQLTEFNSLSGIELARLNVAFSEFTAASLNHFNQNQSQKIDFISSHGVTIYHQPEKNLTLQLGSGGIIAAITGLPTVCDFRVQDVAKGGQGAPLVPFVDSVLFSDFDYTLNLGGFANVSVIQGKKTIGFDITVCNLILNHLALLANHRFDKNGDIAARGTLNIPLFNELNNLDYYAKSTPKSLGREWFERCILPLLDSQSMVSIEDKMHTASEHIAFQIGSVMNKTGTKCLVTGGGALNTHLVERIKHHAVAEIHIPNKQLIEFKECVAFAFLGLSRLLEEPNVLVSVTGAKSETSLGAVYLP